jgi:hypothetical protein
MIWFIIYLVWAFILKFTKNVLFGDQGVLFHLLDFALSHFYLGGDVGGVAGENPGN